MKKKRPFILQLLVDVPAGVGMLVTPMVFMIGMWFGFKEGTSSVVNLSAKIFLTYVIACTYYLYGKAFMRRFNKKRRKKK